MEGIRSGEESLWKSSGLNRDRVRYLSGNQRRKNGRGGESRVRCLGLEDDAVDPQIRTRRCASPAQHGELLLGSENERMQT